MILVKTTTRTKLRRSNSGCSVQPHGHCSAASSHRWVELDTTLRDRLTVEETAHPGAQLPMLIRGSYYAGWEPSGVNSGGAGMAAATALVRVGRHKIEITRPEKVLFPEDGITKGELIEYYARIAPRMLPHLRDRPLTLERYPDGLGKQRIFQKQVSSYFPQWIRRVIVKKVGGTVTHLVCNDDATLVYLANQACITPHIFLSRVDKLDVPDQMVFDLDPQGEDFEPVRSTAQAFKQLLDDLELPAYLKTTGSRGLHIVVPLQRREGFDAVRDFARELAGIVIGQAPGERTLETLKVNRGSRVFIDTNRNAYAQLLAPAFAVRARRGGPVSVPLDWSELRRKDLRSDGVTIRTIFDWLEKAGDPWADFWRSGVSLTKARRKLEQRG
ncbi:MAG TPA: non-homologous end-joining DNA ligase [Gemmatimonadales bacterium]